MSTRPSSEFGSAANRYEILAKLATGGMAEIFLARGLNATGVQRHVVLKRILRQRASDVQFVKMFLDEARLAAQLQHANVAQVYDIGRLGDSYFFTMEYVHGETVRALLHRAHALKRPLPLGAALAIAVGAASGLHHAHERVGVDGRTLGIVHRDVSPSNLMVSFDGGVKVVDFGVAKASDRMSETRSGTVKGKISYLSPEQCMGSPVDRRSDVFALGIVMWEMLATDRLYRRNSDFENMNAIVNEPAPLPSSRRADVPPELDGLVLKMMAKAPADRFQTCAELIEAIETLAARRGIVLSASGLGRLLKDMFGLRPEPWVEIESAHMAEGGVTVTSEPIPAELQLPIEESFEMQLGVLPDLSVANQIVDEPISNSAPRAAAAARPTGAVAIATAASAPPRFTTGPTRASRPVEPREPVATAAITRVEAQTTPMDAVAPPTEPDQPSPVPAAAMAMTASLVSQQIASAAATGSASIVRERAARRTPVLPIIMVAAAALGIAIGVIVTRHDDATPERVAATGSGSAAAFKPVLIDAAVVAPAIDAAVAPIAAVGAPLDASIDLAPALDAAAAPPPPPPTIPQLFAGSHWVELADRCAEHAVAGDAAPLCAIAACKLHRDAEAHRYFAATAASRRDRITAACPALGRRAPDGGSAAQQAQPPPHDNCDADPMACPH
nr:serine/threonine-protein kinase [Kofleriaceae bacterium]